MGCPSNSLYAVHSITNCLSTPAWYSLEAAVALDEGFFCALLLQPLNISGLRYMTAY